jgi:hypothetical protein
LSALAQLHSKQVNGYDRLPPHESETAQKIQGLMETVCKKAKRWFNAEYFYSYIDKPFFMQNELVDPLEALGMPIEYNHKEW